MYEKKERFKTILKDKGLKATDQRITVLEVLPDRPNIHFTVEEIYELVKDKKTDIGIATICRYSGLSWCNKAQRTSCNENIARCGSGNKTLIRRNNADKMRTQSGTNAFM